MSQRCFPPGLYHDEQAQAHLDSFFFPRPSLFLAAAHAPLLGSIHQNEDFVAETPFKDPHHKCEHTCILWGGGGLILEKIYSEKIVGKNTWTPACWGSIWWGKTSNGWQADEPITVAEREGNF